ncbi:protein kinase domain protein [Marinomonas sp. MED121]|nr:protein kinase domain protein [Marinomonas sp. MED121]
MCEIKEDQVTLDLSIKNRFHSDNYQLIEMIGQGGFGVVYKAKQISTDQVVAIKFLSISSEFDEKKRERYLERFQRETSLSSRLQHPNIVRLLDKGVCDDDLVYAVFEYVSGKSLKQHLSEKGALLPAETANLMGQVLDALAHAHDQGVIHRDLKPANIMLSKLGTKEHIKILDFGIGTLSNEVRQHDYKSITLTHETLGTPSYSAPEQLRGESPSIKSDIYVWGLVFIECLTGEPAITGNSLASIFHKQLSLSNVPIPTAVAGHPVANLLRRVLNKKVNERAGDAALIYHDLKQININSLVGDLSLRQPKGSKINVGDNNSQESLLVSNSESLITTEREISGDTKLDEVSAGLLETQINTGLISNAGMIERKQISILCVTLSLKSLTSSNEVELDLEYLDVLHRDAKSQCIDIAIRYGAFHAGTLGDTILFYFGYPSVSDNDSRLCARTALDITSNINQTNALLRSQGQLKVEARMGMHTGMVSHYADAMPEGVAINVAMELARLSRPKQVLCSQSSKSLLEGYIEFKGCFNSFLGAKSVDEIIYQIVGERLNEAFGFLRGTRVSRSFIGREKELQLLEDAFQNINQNDISFIHIKGEAGIGKSRLIYEVRSLARGFQHYMCQFLPEHRHSGLHPIFNIIKNKYNFHDEGNDELAEEFKLNIRSTLEKSPNVDINVSFPLVLTWLNLAIPEEFTHNVLEPDVQKNILFESVAILLLSDRSGNVEIQKLFVFEDAHWSDPTSIDFLLFLFESELYKVSKSIVILTSRVDIPNKIEAKNNLYLELLGFSKNNSSLFIKSLFGKENISDKVVNEILLKTDGIPLFIEELVSMAVSKGIVQHLNGIIDFVSEEAVKEIPETLMEFLQYKIDGLKSSKETVQIASAIGREFDLNILISSSTKGVQDVHSDLFELVQKELIYKQRRIDGDVYIFKHALVRDAIYENLEKNLRVKISDKISDVLISRCDKNSYIDLKDISSHLVIAKRYSEGISYATASIYKMEKLALSSELLSFGTKVLDWFKIFNDQESELQLYKILLSSELMMNSYSSKKASLWSVRIREILNNTEELDLQLSSEMSDNIKVLEFLNLYYSSKFDEAKELGLRLIEEYGENGDDNKNLLVNCFLSQIYQLEGEFDKAIKSFDMLLDNYDPKIHRNIFIESDSDFLPYCKAMMSLSYIHNDTIEKAIKLADESVLLSKKGQYHISCVVSHIFSALSYFFNGDEERVISICESYYENFYCPDNRVYHIVFLEILYFIAKGDLSEARKIILDLYNSSNYFSIGWYTHFLAKKMIEEKKFDEAVEIMELSLAKSENTSEVATLPIILNTLAYSLYKKKGVKTNHIDNLLFLSAKISKKQGAVFFEKESRQILNEMK